MCVALMKVRATSLRPYVLWPNASAPRPLDVHCLNDNRPHLALPPAQSSYSLTIARRVLSLAAWCVASAEHAYADGEREQGVDEHQAALM